MGEHTHTHTTEMRREKRCRKMGERCENIPMVWSVQMIAIYYWMKCCLLLQVVMCGWFSLSHFKHTHTHTVRHTLFLMCAILTVPQKRCCQTEVKQKNTRTHRQESMLCYTIRFRSEALPYITII